ncbi:MAG TPA: response regulator transcription factor [Chthoniobacterales bacterium]|jgi:DNA-binding NarL/FixJ family response regulator|nr:response regulator transcription factor [Chthoniobacterales bacterium]
MKEEITPPPKKIRVMVVDDHSVMRRALRSILETQELLEVVAEADSGQAALDLWSSAQPDVILMDGSMPDMNGMETIRRLRQLAPEVKVIGITLYEQTTYLEEMISVGASGYLLKTGSPSDVVKAIQVVAGGGTYFDPSIPRRAKPVVEEHEIARELSADELAVAKLLAEGQTNRELAEALSLTKTEVESRRSALMKKLGLQTRAELVRLANERHWLG